MKDLLSLQQYKVHENGTCNKQNRVYQIVIYPKRVFEDLMKDLGE